MVCSAMVCCAVLCYVMLRSGMLHYVIRYTLFCGLLCCPIRVMPCYAMPGTRTFVKVSACSVCRSRCRALTTLPADSTVRCRCSTYSTVWTASPTRTTLKTDWRRSVCSKESMSCHVLSFLLWYDRWVIFALMKQLQGSNLGILCVA